MSKQRLAIYVAVMAATAFLGCGGDSGAGDGSATNENFRVVADTTMTTASPPLSKARFIAVTRRICRQGWTVVQDNFRKYLSWREPPETKRERFEKTVQLSLLAGVDFHIFDEIQRLGAASGEERKIEAIIGALQTSVEMGQQLHWRAHTLGEIPPHFRTYNRQAEEYGLSGCAVSMANLRPIEASSR